MKPDSALSPADVLAQVAHALPGEARAEVIIIGSLAAGYHFFAEDGSRAIRTKDVDCLLTPHSEAIDAAAKVTAQLLRANWTLREGPQWSQPGRADDAESALPMVRLRPPSETGKAWFLELLSAPPVFELGTPTKKLRRVTTEIGHFALCSFDFLALVEWRPMETPLGIRIARPEMMALANLLHHPTIGNDLIAGTGYKRSNKDLGRVLALAYLVLERDRRAGADELSQWPQRMWSALQCQFESHAATLAHQAGAGLRALLKSPVDLEQSLRIANLGLLASLDVSIDAFRSTGARLIVEVIEELEDLAQGQ